MKFVNFTAKHRKRIGVLQDETIIDLLSAYDTYKSEIDYDTPFPKLVDMTQVIELGAFGINAAQRIVKLVTTQREESNETDLTLEERHVKLNAPIQNPRKIICVGLNYADHAKEGGRKQLPQEPILFSKPPTAIIGPEDPIIYPKISEQVDYEVELAVVIGKKGKDIPKQEAFDYIFGYTVFNDVSARDLQFRDGQWFRGKSFDSFAPIGPCLVSKDEIANPNNLRLWLNVNGETRQSSSTKNMIFQVPDLVAFISEVMTLEPGDLIATGTPAGVGIYSKPEPRLLQPGDVVEAGIENIGVLRNFVMTHHGF